MKILVHLSCALWLCAGIAWAQPNNSTCELAPASEEDVRVRDLLLQADRVKLEVESVGVDKNGYGEPVIKDVATVFPGDFHHALEKLRLRPFKSNGFGTSTNPILYFVFLQEDRELGLLSLGYNGRASEYWISAPDSRRKRERANLNPEAVLLLRLWVGEHPQLQKILLRLGAEASDLRPDLRQPTAKKR